jgi:hypothetical protein
MGGFPGVFGSLIRGHHGQIINLETGESNAAVAIRGSFQFNGIKRLSVEFDGVGGSDHARGNGAAR